MDTYAACGRLAHAKGEARTVGSLVKPFGVEHGIRREKEELADGNPRHIPRGRRRRALVELAQARGGLRADGDHSTYVPRPAGLQSGRPDRRNPRHGRIPELHADRPGSWGHEAWPGAP